MGGFNRASFLKRQKEQKRLAKQAAKRELRRARKEAKADGEEEPEATSDEIDYSFLEEEGFRPSAPEPKAPPSDAQSDTPEAAETEESRPGDSP